MPYIKDFLDRETINRRNFLIGSALGVGGIAASSLAFPGMAQATLKNPTIAWSYRNRTNPYWNQIVTGGEAFVTSLGKPKGALVQLINDGSSEKSLADVKALLDKTNGNLALAIDTNDAPNCRPVVEAVAAKKAYVSTIWNKTNDIHPWQFGDNWVSHMTWSDVGPSEQTATVLFNAMGGKGAIVGIGGIASNNPAIERRQGLGNALKKFPGIKLLDYQAADWSTQKANQVMSDFLTRFGGEISGVFVANDSMAYGVLAALRAEGKAGKIPVVSYDGNAQAINLIAKGELLATVSTNPYWAGGITASLAYHAAIGTFVPSKEPKAHREFYGPTILITQKDVAAFKKKYVENTPKYNWSDFWSMTRGPIKYT